MQNRLTAEGGIKLLKENTLENLPLGSSVRISRCLSPLRADVYRLLEMGLCRGALVTVLQNGRVFGAIELALNDSRLCIANELANQFLAVSQVPQS